MSESFTLADRLAARDLGTYLSRAAAVEDGAVRLVAGSGVLAVYTAVLYPRGLLDETPTVLGLRVIATDPAAEFDVVVPSRSLRERLSRAVAAAGERDGALRLVPPLGVSTVTWAGISPPRGGWREVGVLEAGLVRAQAEEGIAEVAAAVPGAVGEQLVRAVRSEVWGRILPGTLDVPTGAAFAASTLGFLGEDAVSLHETGPWTRLTAPGGHVLVKRKNWTLKP